MGRVQHIQAIYVCASTHVAMRYTPPKCQKLDYVKPRLISLFFFCGVHFYLMVKGNSITFYAISCIFIFYLTNNKFSCLLGNPFRAKATIHPPYTSPTLLPASQLPFGRWPRSLITPCLFSTTPLCRNGGLSGRHCSIYFLSIFFSNIVSPFCWLVFYSILTK